MFDGNKRGEEHETEELGYHNIFQHKLKERKREVWSSTVQREEIAEQIEEGFGPVIVINWKKSTSWFS